MKELADHVDHVGRKDQQEQTQAHCSEVLPQTPTRDTIKILGLWQVQLNANGVSRVDTTTSTTTTIKSTNSCYSFLRLKYS